MKFGSLVRLVTFVITAVSGIAMLDAAQAVGASTNGVSTHAVMSDGMFLLLLIAVLALTFVCIRLLPLVEAFEAFVMRE